MEPTADVLAGLKQAVGRCLDASQGKLHALSRDIWSCPELAYEEAKAHDRLVDFFRQEGGWRVDGHFKLDTAFRASWRTEGAAGKVVNVGFLCEYDALPGMGHACGHNLIAEVGAAAALGLRAALEEEQRLPVQVEVGVRCRCCGGWVHRTGPQRGCNAKKERYTLTGVRFRLPVTCLQCVLCILTSVFFFFLHLNVMNMQF